jgi:hypothetical protein
VVHGLSWLTAERLELVDNNSVGIVVVVVLNWSG